MMGDNYSNAHFVSVWLGQEQTQTKVPVKFDRLEQFLQNPYLYHSDNIESYIEGGVLRLAQHPYWTRIWVIQEFRLAAKVHILCDGHVMPWHRLEYAFQELMSRPSAPINPFVSYSSFMEHGATSSLPPDQSLHCLLEKYRNSQCKDPRDRVFGMLCLVISEDRKFLKQFVPDYTMHIDDVVVLALAHCEQHSLPKERDRGRHAPRGRFYGDMKN
jgi:hypothetical protein